MKMRRLDNSIIKELLGSDRDSHLLSGPVVGMELIGKDVVQNWLIMQGPDDASQSRSQNSETIRGAYARDSSRNICLGSLTAEQAERQLQFFFERISPDHVSYSNEVSCIVIKNHIIKERKVGQLLSYLQEQLSKYDMTIDNLEIFKLEKPAAGEFLEIYKDVVPEYQDIVNDMSVGPVMALAIRGQDLVVQTIRKLVGPHDIKLAKSLRNGTLRALFGRNQVQNGVHCTDLEDDGAYDCHFFFNILQG